MLQASVEIQHHGVSGLRLRCFDRIEDLTKGVHLERLRALGSAQELLVLFLDSRLSNDRVRLIALRELGQFLGDGTDVAEDVWR